MINYALEKNLQGIAITDHGKALKGPGISSIFLNRFPQEYKGLKIWKGIEANVLPSGQTDVPKDLAAKLDLILLAIHPNIEQGRPEDYYTNLLLDCLKQNPFIDILAHPDITFYPLNMKEIVKTAKELGIALEFNNSNITYKKTNLTKMKEMSQAILETGCRVIISGDAHAITEIGEDRDIVKTFKELNIPDMPLVNKNLETAAAFISERKQIRQSYFSNTDKK